MDGFDNNSMILLDMTDVRLKTAYLTDKLISTSLAPSLDLFEDRQAVQNEQSTSTKTIILPIMDDEEGSSSSPSWSPHADQMPYAYTDYTWGADIDINAIDLEWNQDWLGEASLDSESPQNTSNANVTNLQYQLGTNFGGECNNNSIHTANELDGLPMPTWDNLNEISDLPSLENFDNFLSIQSAYMSGNVSNSLSSFNYPIGPIFPTASTDLFANHIHCDPYPATFNHTEAQQAYESYPIDWDTHLPILDNSLCDPMQSSLYISSSTGVQVPSVSPATTSPITSNSEIMSSPTQSSDTNTHNSTCNSNSELTTPSSDRPTSTSSPSVQNEYMCTICSKTFSKRFEFNKHKPLHTLPHACTICPHRTARRRDMTRHVAAKHKDVGLSGPQPASKPICPVEHCKQGFARPDHLLRHLRRKHPGYKLGP